MSGYELLTFDLASGSVLWIAVAIVHGKGFPDLAAHRNAEPT